MFEGRLIGRASKPEVVRRRWTNSLFGYSVILVDIHE